jgi:hypothetical protein
MITGHAVSELDGNARIWTLTVNAIPTPGALIEWDEPACGSIPAQTGVRGWISSQESNRPGTLLLTVAGAGSRWVKIVVKAQPQPSPEQSRFITVGTKVYSANGNPGIVTGYSLGGLIQVHLDNGRDISCLADLVTLHPRMIDAQTGDDLLSALAGIKPDNRYRALEAMGVRILRDAADLCGIDSEGMGKRAAIMAIIENF